MFRLALVAFLVLAAAAQAQSLPQPGKPLRIVVGFAAGGGTDIQARIVAPKLGEALGVPVIVENKPGASTMVAAAEVARAASDGYTLLYTFNGTFAQNPFTQASVPYDPFRDFTPVSLGARGSQILVLHTSIPAANVAELVAWARAHPGQLNIASFGAGTSSHIFAELLIRQSGVPMTHVPYKGTGDAVKDLLAGRVQLMFDAGPSAVQNVATGRLRMLGIVAPARSPLLPLVPTLAEQGYRGIDLVGWLGFYAPANLPPDTLRALNAALARALAAPEVKDGFAKGIYEAVSSSPEELAALTRQSYEQWGKIIRELGIKPQ
ncbi:MAG TPA: tripartite tricarboxylate transporter substrate-binding protein [Burkholderiales bacterium]|nr:tripartite tricarboxylate transporter substrate-binding protein [Burkholderiales bacterium]